jgi:hypothetical protein
MTIDVSYKQASSSWLVSKTLDSLKDYPLLSFDIETKGLYTKAERKEALQLLEDNPESYYRSLVSIVAHNNGLSYPSLVDVTHFIFGTSSSTAVVIVPEDRQTEMRVWRWVSKYKGKLLIHNTLFDLKVMYHRIGCFPKNYEDTALMAKTLINNSDVWKAKTGLKELVGEYYPPEWALFDQYEPENSKDPKFIQYAATDGAATYLLYELIEEM